jgi:hypothetical protein
MDVDKSGELEVTKAAEVFAAIFRARAYGVIHFKGPEGETVFVTFKRGVAQHASGKGREGETAIRAVLKWEEGEYRFIEDVRPDDEDFPPNVPEVVAEALGLGKRKLEAAPPASLPPLPVLPAGSAAPPPKADTFSALCEGLAEAAFTGCCVRVSPGGRDGLFVFLRGSLAGGIFWDGLRFQRGDAADPAWQEPEIEKGGVFELFALPPETARAFEAGVTGAVAITRLPAAAVNVEEFLSWVENSRYTALISIVGGERVANILIGEGEVLGAVVAPQAEVNADTEEALALYYTRGATVEAFIAP